MLLTVQEEGAYRTLIPTYQGAGESNAGLLGCSSKPLVHEVQNPERQRLVSVVIPHRVLLQVLNSRHGQRSRSSRLTAPETHC